MTTRQQQDAQRQAEMRLVAERTNQQAGEQWAAFEQQQAASGEGGGEQAVLAVQRVDIDG